MRVTCTNCDRRGLIDAASPSDLSPRAVCPRCDAPFRAVPSGFEATTVATAVIATTAATHAHAPTPAFITARASISQAAAAPRALIAAPSRATARDEDVLALPRMKVHDATRVDGAGVMLDPDGGLFAHDSRARARADNDHYKVAVRLMNVSPLWMLAACAGFLVLVFVFDLLLTNAPRASGDASAHASVNNQATNRGTARRGRTADAAITVEMTADETGRDEDEASTGYDGGSPADAPAVRNELKPAPISDAPAVLTDTPARAAAAVSFANEGGGDLRADAGGGAQALRTTIQLGSFRVATEAEAQAGTLRAAGFDARVVEQQSSKRPWFCVQTGLFGARADAERHLSELRAKGFAASYTMRELL